MSPSPPAAPWLGHLRRVLGWLIVLVPLWAALRPTPGTLWGAESAGIYSRLHGWWYAAQNAPPILGFPRAGVAPQPEPLARLVGGLVPELVRSVGAPALVLGLLGLQLGACIVVARRATYAAGPVWGPVSAAIFCVSPGMLTFLAEGDAEAGAAFGVLLAPLCPGLWVVPAGLLLALLAPGLVPVALLHGAVSAWPDADPVRRRALGFAGIASALLALGLGLPRPRTPDLVGWLTHIDPGPDPEQFPVFVGFLPLACLVVALTVPEARRMVAGAAIALALAGVRSPLPTDRLLILVPLYAALGAAAASARWFPSIHVQSGLLCGALLLGEAWMGASVPLPLPRVALAPPEPLAAVPPGPVLDLPATPGASQKSRYFQSIHGQPIAGDPQGQLHPSVLEHVDALVAGSCPDLHAAGFRSVIARREQSFVQIGSLITCLGTPRADDGNVAVWALDGTLTSGGTEGG